MTPAIVVADVERLVPRAARTRRTRRVLMTVLAALAAASLAAAFTGRTTDAGILPAGGSTVVVLDLSGSTRATLRRVATVLLRLTGDGTRRVGLVVFSDTGYEALPLGAPASALRGWLEPIADGPRSRYPWAASFTGGTVISSGLSIALRMLGHAPAAGRHVLLVSDLVDGVVDLPRLQSIVARYQRERIDLRVVTVSDQSSGGGSPGGFLRLPNAGFVTSAASRVSGSELVSASAPPFPWVAVVLVVLVALAAAAWELLLHPLAWRRT